MKLKRNLNEDRIGSMPLRPAITVHQATIIRAAVARMRTAELGCAVIVDGNERAIGIFTERSLLNVLLQDISLDNATVGDFPDPEFLAVKSSAPASRLWDAVWRDGYRFVCVTDETGKLIGLTGQRGLAEYISDCYPQQVLVQRLGCQPGIDQREGA